MCDGTVYEYRCVGVEVSSLAGWWVVGGVVAGVWVVAVWRKESVCSPLFLLSLPVDIQHNQSVSVPTLHIPMYQVYKICAHKSQMCLM